MFIKRYRLYNSALRQKLWVDETHFSDQLHPPASPLERNEPQANADGGEEEVVSAVPW
jgi:hypothetical protein